jgi:hypothetical protein
MWVGMYERHYAPEVPVAKADMLSRYDDTAKARYAKDAERHQGTD